MATVAAARVRDLTGREVYFYQVTERETADGVVAAVEAMVGEPDPDAPAGRRPLVVLDNVDACPDGSEAVSRLLDDMPDADPAGHLPGAAAAALRADDRGPAARRAGARRPAAEIEESPAVQLFLRIARQADPGLDVRGHEAALAEVCRLLDGVPLAIELAAARVRLVGIDGLRESLESGLELLRTTAPDVPERQRALASTIAWSHDRLGDERATAVPAARGLRAGLHPGGGGSGRGRRGRRDRALTQVMEAGLIRPVDGRVRIGFVMLATVRAFVRRLAPTRARTTPRGWPWRRTCSTTSPAGRHDLDRARGPLALARFLDVGSDVLASIEAALRLGRVDEGVALTLASGPFWVASGDLRAGLARTWRR